MSNGPRGAQHDASAPRAGLTPTLVLFTSLALAAFAANSLLARAAIGPGPDGSAAIGAVAFTALRLAAGAAALAPWWWRTRDRTGQGRSDTRRGAIGALWLGAYALPFAWAYVSLGAATGALLLFGAVQLTMLLAGRRAGERLGTGGALGVAAALAGLAVLLGPGLRAPPLLAALAMLGAGVAWGAYSLAGRHEADPKRATARNFVWATPLALVLALWPGAWDGATLHGALLALASGSVASGLGYLVWYRALPGLSRTSAAVVQLCVPVVAAFGAIAFLGEALDARLVVASALVLGGVGLAVLRR